MAADSHGFLWVNQVPALEHYPSHVVMATAVGAVLVGSAALFNLSLKRAMNAPGGAVVPESRWSFRNFFEIIAESLYNLTQSVIGHHEADKYFPLVATLFAFIFTNNILGLIPGVLPATDNLNTTLAMGIFVFVYYNYEGVKANGWGHIKHMAGPVWLLAPLIFVIELASHLARPFSLGMRLRGNIYGDHLVVGLFNDLVPYLVPVIFYGLGVFVSFIQAFVFCLLTMVYISLATAHDDH